jgi:uncharacterized protein (TIGR02391 family)
MQLQQQTIEGIAKVIGDTNDGLTGSQIGQYLKVCNSPDKYDGITKWKRLYNALLESHNASYNGDPILGFVKHIMNPSLWVQNQEKFDLIRTRLNSILLFEGLEIDKEGLLKKVVQAKTISEVKQRLNSFKSKLESFKVHPIIFYYCKEELLHDNYFHAVFEASKSIFDRIKELTNLTNDGAALVDDVFLSKPYPILLINNFCSESEKSEQKGFANYLKGIYGMFRNPEAHSAKIKWTINEEDAIQAMVLISFCHKKLDNTIKVR